MQKGFVNFAFALFAALLLTGSAFADGNGTGAVNQPPVITNINGPVSLGTNEQGTWSITAYDPDGTYLAYNVVWGDEAQRGVQASTTFGSTAAFQHSYTQPGTYTITFIVKDASGATSQTTGAIMISQGSSNLQIFSTWQADENFEPLHMLYTQILDNGAVANLNNVKVTLQVSTPSGRSETYDIGYHSPGTAYSNNDYYGFGYSSGAQCGTYNYNIYAARKDGSAAVGPMSGSFTLSSQCLSSDNAQLATLGKISYWFGKVNQHTDASGAWQTDPDGTSGANLNKITYCRKFYPGTTDIRETDVSTHSGWKNNGNSGDYTTTKAVYNCVGSQTTNGNLPPVINGVSGPTSLNLSQTGAWKVSAYDPDGTYLTYSVNWGDGSDPLGVGNKQNNVVSSASFQHTYYNTERQYTITFTVTDQSGASSQSTITVSVGGSSGNRPPVITSVSGPSSLSTNQQGTWSISASDPDGTQLSYSVLWGDEQVGALYKDQVGSVATFPHTYSQAGAYMITFTVKDAQGATAQSAAYVNVGGYSSGCDSSFNHLTVGQMLQVPPMTNTYGVKLIDISADSDRAAMVQILDSNEAVLDYAKVVPGTRYVYAGKSGNLAIETCNAASASNDVNSAWIKGAMTTSPGTDICAGYHTLVQDQVLDVGTFYVRLDGVSTAQGITASQRYANIDIMTPVGMPLDKKQMYPGTAYSYTQNGTANTVNVKLCDTAYGIADGKKWVKIDATAASDPNNLPPVINGVSGPSSLSTGSAGTWKVSANDPDGNYLTYSVNWGDGGGMAKSGSGSAYATVTFEHTYSKAGTYTVKFTVTDIAGATAQSDAVVDVAGSTITPSERLSFKIKKGWNMLSSPADTTSGIDVMAIAQKCDVATNAWEYDAANGKYVASTSIKPKGAWLRANADCEFWIDPPYTTRVRFALSAGWNIVGAPGTATAFSSMTGNCKVTSGPWAYSPSSGQYSQSRLLEPTNAYWVKVASACTMENTGDVPPSAPEN